VLVNDENTRSLGEWLRHQREELDVSLDQAEADTRIRSRYLQALEQEDFDELPDPVVGRGFLRNYAAYLELDVQSAVDRYSEVVAPPEPEPLSIDESSPFASGPFRPVALHEMPSRRSRLGLLAGLVAVVVIAVALLAWWARPYISAYAPWERILALLPSAASTPVEAIVDLPTATRTATVAATEATAPSPAATTESTLTPEPSPTMTFTPSPSPTASSVIYTGIFLELLFIDTSWMQVTVDGIRQFQGELEAGTRRSWYGENRIELRLGNAGGVEVTLNGQKLDPLGEPGEVVDRVFELVGEEISEATVTPAPTVDLTAFPPTATVVDTPVPSATSEISPTATLTATATVTTTATATTTPAP
jgi:cytoskeletal protein RodZ